MPGLLVLALFLIAALVASHVAVVGALARWRYPETAPAGSGEPGGELTA